MQENHHRETFSEYLILGGGLAGSTLALAMARQGVKPALLHAHHRQTPDTAAASLVPLALYNPAAAMKARMGWEAIKCDEALNLLIEELGNFCGGTEHFVKQTGVLRPCLDAQMQKNFQKSLQQHDWPDGWVSWKTPEELKSEFPGVKHTFGGLWVPVGKTFNMPVLLKCLHAMLREKYGVDIIEAEVQELHPISSAGRNRAQWQLRAQMSSPEKRPSVQAETGTEQHSGPDAITRHFTARSVVAACGSRLPFLLKDFLPEAFKAHCVKGQTLGLSRPVPETFRPSVASKGYFAFFDDRAVVGSTYEHHFEKHDALKTTDDARQRLLAKIERTFKAGKAGPETLQAYEQWAGIRLTTPDRLPVMGALPDTAGLYISAGFGSKGLTYSSRCADLLAGQLLLGHSLPFEVDLKRQLPPES